MTAEFSDALLYLITIIELTGYCLIRLALMRVQPCRLVLKKLKKIPQIPGKLIFLLFFYFQVSFL